MLLGLGLGTAGAGALGRGGINPLFATIGDSQVANGITNTATSKQYNPAGTMTMARRLSNQRIIYPLANQLGVGGTTISTIKGTAAAAVATGSKFIVFCGGTNDGSSGAAGLAAREQDAVDTFATILNGGANVIVLPLIRRTDAGKSANTDAFCDGFNAWLYAGGVLGTSTGGRVVQAMSIAAAIASPPALGTRVIVCDFTSLVGGDNEPLAGTLLSDGLHHNGKTAITAGQQISDLIAAYNAISSNTAASGTDVWALQATNHGLLAGTGGSALTQSGFTGSGQVATGWQVNYSGGTATWTGVCSKIAALSGNGSFAGQRIVCASSAIGTTASEICNLQCLTNLTAGISAGDQIYIECLFNVADPVNFRGIHLQIREIGPAAPQTTADAYGSGTSMNTAHSGKLRSSAITIQSGITAMAVVFQNAFVGNVSAFGATLEVSDVRVMKL